jgi:hypothetical protein
MVGKQDWIQTAFIDKSVSENGNSLTKKMVLLSLKSNAKSTK